MREWNRLEEAGRYLIEGIELIEKWGEMAAIYPGYIPLARLRQAQGNLPEALEIIQKVQRLAVQTPATQIDDWITEMVQVSLSIANGDLGLAEDWVERRGLLHPPDPAGLKDSEVFAYAHLRKYELVVLARLRLAQGRAGEALQLLDALLLDVVKLPRLGLRLEMLLVQALSLDAAGKRDEAIDAVEAALSLAEPAGYLRLFLDEGQPMFQLLAGAQRRNPSSTYIAGLLAAFEGERIPAGKVKAGFATPPTLLAENEPLSERELQVLSLLRSRLTVPEIAQELCVAESTLRSHVKSIYGKLGVHRRADAVQRAEELGWLTGRS
jgi:LuxR family maltose regulon positive regulatory protein